jgi:hypothetical protein
LRATDLDIKLINLCSEINVKLPIRISPEIWKKFSKDKLIRNHLKQSWNSWGWAFEIGGGRRLKVGEYQSLALKTTHGCRPEQEYQKFRLLAL